MIFCVLICIFLLRTSGKRTTDESDFRHYYGNFLKVPFWNFLITAMFKVLSQQLGGTLTTALEVTPYSWRFYGHEPT